MDKKLEILDSCQCPFCSISLRSCKNDWIVSDLDIHRGKPKKSNNNDLLETEKNSKIMSNYSNENTTNPILNDITKSYINFDSVAYTFSYCVSYLSKE